MTFKTFLSTTILLAAAAQVQATLDQSQKINSGYAYTMHSTSPSEDELGQFPPAYQKPTIEHVLQGPKHTLIWRDRVSNRTQDNASLALGERRMGLFIPHWPQDKLPSEATGWTAYGDPLSYSHFSVKVERAEGEREVAGSMAQHYVLTADYTRQLGNDPASERYQMYTDLWVLTDKPFSFAPFHKAGAYSDPRFGAAVVAELSGLGMVVRSDARYSSTAIDENGAEIGSKREGTWTTWVEDLKSADVPGLNFPVGDHQTLHVLQSEFRKQAAATCTAVLAGETPDFIKQNLDNIQQTAVLKDLHNSCKSQVLRAFTRDMKKNPQSVCGDIIAGNSPESINQVLNADEKQDFMQSAVSFCEQQALQ